VTLIASPVRSIPLERLEQERIEWVELERMALLVELELQRERERLEQRVKEQNLQFTPELEPEDCKGLLQSDERPSSPLRRTNQSASDVDLALANFKTTHCPWRDSESWLVANQDHIFATVNMFLSLSNPDEVELASIRNARVYQVSYSPMQHRRDVLKRSGGFSVLL
jgi:hypothetical protein